MKDNTNLDEFKKFIDNNFHTERIKRYKYLLIFLSIIALSVFVFIFYVLSFLEEKYHLYFFFDGVYGNELKAVALVMYLILIISLFLMLVKKVFFRFVMMIFALPFFLYVLMFADRFANSFTSEFRYYKSPDESKEIIVVRTGHSFSGFNDFYVRENDFFIRSLGVGVATEKEEYVEEDLIWLDNDSFMYTYKSDRKDISKVIDLD